MILSQCRWVESMLPWSHGLGRIMVAVGDAVSSHHGKQEANVGKDQETGVTWKVHSLGSTASYLAPPP